ncbi:MAG: hypothetical protein AAGK04_07100 [Planctomycetota bacterium]
MQDIRRVLRQASGRLMMIGFLQWLMVALAIGLAVVIGARLVEKVGGWSIAWSPLVLWTTIGVLAFAGVATVLTRRREMDVARTLDDRADLKESLSTALCVERDASAWSRAVVEVAQQRANKVKVNQALPIEAPRRWGLPMGLAMALTVIWFAVPSIDLSGSVAQAEEIEREQAERERVEAEIDKVEAQVEEALKKAGLAQGEGDDLPTPEPEDLSKPVKPEELQRQMVKRLTSAAERLDRQANGERGEQLKTLRERFQKLRQPGAGPLNQMSRSLARGNFTGAKESLEELANQLGEGQLSDQQKKQAKKQLANLAKQVDKLAEENEELAKALEKAGVDPKQAAQVAQNPEAMREALEQLENMSPEQMQQLMQQAQAQQMARQQMQNMAGAMSQMAQGMGEDGMNQEGMQGMDGLGQELSQAEALSQDMESLDAAMQQVQSQLSQMGQQMGEQSWGQCEGGQGLGLGDQGAFAQGESASQGMGSGGPGQGQGAGPDEAPADFTFKREKATVKTGAGPIIASRMIYGEQVRGESTATFAEAVQLASEQASEAIETNLVPRELQGAVKSYFGTLERRAAQQRQQQEGAPPTPTPTEDAEDAG